MRHLIQRATLQLLRAYKWAISPMFPPSCRYTPTCSEYAMEAVERYGALRGGMLTLARLLRCHPLARGGYDPVIKSDVDGSRNNGCPSTELSLNSEPLRAAFSVQKISGFNPSGRFLKRNS